MSTEDKVTIMCDDLINVMSPNSTETASQGLAIVESDLDAIGRDFGPVPRTNLEKDSSLQIPADLNYWVGVLEHQTGYERANGSGGPRARCHDTFSSGPRTRSTYPALGDGGCPKGSRPSYPPPSRLTLQSLNIDGHPFATRRLLNPHVARTSELQRAATNSAHQVTPQHHKYQ